MPQFVPFGQSARNMSRKRKSIADTIVAGEITNNNIADYFKKIPSVVHVDVGSDVEDLVDDAEQRHGPVVCPTVKPLTEKQLIQRALDKINVDKVCEINRNIKKQKLLSHIDKFTFVQFSSIKRYYELRLAGTKKCHASQQAAQLYYNSSAEYTSYKSTSIRSWAQYYMVHLELKTFKQGKNVKTRVA